MNLLSSIHVFSITSAAGILEETTNKGNTTLEKALFSHADAVTSRYFDNNVYYRGIVEFSNVCANDCGYCGIRKHIKGVKRYTIPIPEVVEVAKWAFENRMGTLMLQSGELPTPQRLEYLKELVQQVAEATVAMDLERRGLDPKASIPAFNIVIFSIAAVLQLSGCPSQFTLQHIVGVWQGVASIL